MSSVRKKYSTPRITFNDGEKAAIPAAIAAAIGGLSLAKLAVAGTAAALAASSRDIHSGAVRALSLKKF